MWPLNAAAATQQKVVNLTTQTLHELIAVGSDRARSGIELTALGITNWQRGTDAAPTSQQIDPDNWIDPKTGMSNYEASATSTGDALDAASDLDDGTWLNLGTSRLWIVERPTPPAGTTSAVVTIQIRHATSLVVLTTAVYTITAERL